MTDIVERLRSPAVGNTIMGNEAADEIERLRARVSELEAALQKIAYPPDDIDAPHYPVSIARAALTPRSNSPADDHSTT